jgi:hypothetical protein
MNKKLKITVANKLITEKRDMSIYHQFTRSAHIISHNNSLTLPLLTVVEDDYLHISLISGPGPIIGRYVIDLPSWVDFEFCSEGNIKIHHYRNRTLLKIPPGLPLWQLKITQSSFLNVPVLADSVTVGDDTSDHL